MNTTPEKIEIAASDDQVRKVEEWMKQHNVEPNQEAMARRKIELPKDPVSSGGNQQEQVMDNIIPKQTSVTVSEEERTLYLKAMLTDNPVMLDVFLYGTEMKLTFRSRNMHEQERVLAVVRQDIKDGLIDEADAALAFTRVQQYCICLQLRKINDKTFTGLELTPGSTLQEDAIILRKAYLDYIPKMPQPKWVAILEGLVQFESKCKKISEECLNEDFMKPRG